MMVLKSRKFWATLLGVAGVLGLHFFGQGLPVDAAVDALQWLIGTFVAATAIEDGLKGGKTEQIADAIFHTMERRGMVSRDVEIRNRN